MILFRPFLRKEKDGLNRSGVAYFEVPAGGLVWVPANTTTIALAGLPEKLDAMGKADYDGRNLMPLLGNPTRDWAAGFRQNVR